MIRKNKIRNVFLFFLISSIGILLFYNYLSGRPMSSLLLLEEQQAIQNEIAGKVTIIILIFMIVATAIFYLLYESYRTVNNELAERMEMLDASRNDLQTTYDSVGIFFIEIDSDLTILNINSAFSDYIGKRKNSIIGKKLFSVLDFGTSTSATLGVTIQEVFDFNRSARCEIESNRNIYEILLFPLKATRDKTRKALLMLNDVTHARILERQMLQDNKMIAIGQLAAGVAHEIRNPLGIIRNYCYVIKNSDNYDQPTFEKAILSIEKACDKSSRIIDNLLDFSRMSSNKIELINLSEFIRSILSLEGNLMSSKGVETYLNCSEAADINTIPESLEIILMNLILNAVDAMPSGGTIHIDCLQENDTLQIKVIDTGVGIPEENLGSIFNPFFTTKEKRDGSGLGLYIVYNETEKLGGRVEVESSFGEGTVFTLKFPTLRGENHGKQKV